MKKVVGVFITAAVILSGAGCATMSNSEQGALVGAIGGALIGSQISDHSGGSAAGAVIGAAIGGMAGAYIGGYMDRQAADMRQSVGEADVERVGEGIMVSFDLDLLFEAGGFHLLLSGRNDLDRLAVILGRYPDTRIFIEGRAFRPGTGEPDYRLSARRARVMADYLRGRNVRSGRFTVGGYGGTRSVRNDRLSSRRMGLAIVADSKLKRAAASHPR